MRCSISVRPLGQGWSVSSDQIANLMVFTKGPCAEATARRLVSSLRRHGVSVEIDIWLRDGTRACHWILEPERERAQPLGGRRPVPDRVH